jgi:nucleoside-diphosphate-sugar epimerase
MRVVLFGAKGFLGSALRRHFLQRQWSVISVIRAKTESADPSAIESADAAKVEDAVQTADAVVLAALSMGLQMQQVDETLLSLALRSPDRVPLVYTSASLLYGDARGASVDESAPLSPPAFMGWRPEHERRVHESRRPRAYVARLAGLYGEGGGGPFHLAQMGKALGGIPVVDGGSQLQSFVHCDDVANLYASLIESTNDVPRLLNVSAGVVSARAMAESVGKATALPILSWTRADAEHALGPMAALLTASTSVDASLAKKTVGFQPQQLGVLDELAANGVKH